MKSIQKFFNEDNTLNKGYVKHNNPRTVGSNRKKFEQLLPPIDIIEEYEAAYPGIFTKLVAMAEQEQQHRHKLDLLNIKCQEDAIKLGKNLSLILFAALLLALFAMIYTVGATMLTVIVIAAIALFAIFVKRKKISFSGESADKEPVKERMTQQIKNPNHIVKAENDRQNTRTSSRRKIGFKRRQKQDRP